MHWDTILSLCGMLLVVGAILVLAYWTTRWIAKSGISGPLGGLSDPRLTVLYQLRLGSSEQLVLVRVGERCLLLGVTPGGIAVLSELTGEEAEMWRAGREKPSAGQPAFLEVLQKKWPGRK